MYIPRMAKWSDANYVLSAPQNAKNENQLKHKNQGHNRFLSTVRSPRMKDYTFPYEVSTNQSNVYINLKKKLRKFGNFFFTRNRLCKHKLVDRNCMLVLMIS